MAQTHDIHTELKEITDSYWSENKKPLLLSNLVPLLKEKGVDYKSITGDISLKQFIKSTGQEYGYQLNEHPTQKEKIGIIPSDQNFTYNIEDIPRVPKPHTMKKGEDILISFFKRLSRLSDEDIEKVHIPASVIVKLLK